MYPESPGWNTLASTYLQLGMYEEVLEISPESRHAIRAYRALGREEEAFALAERLLEGEPDELPLGLRFDFQLALGNVEEAVTLFEQAYDEHAAWLVEAVNPWNDPLRDDPRFIEILGRMRLER
jgi:tetratricopeptide (TPR) repeat protein